MLNIIILYLHMIINVYLIIYNKFLIFEIKVYYFYKFKSFKVCNINFYNKKF